MSYNLPQNLHYGNKLQKNKIIFAKTVYNKQIVCYNKSAMGNNRTIENR